MARSLRFSNGAAVRLSGSSPKLGRVALHGGAPLPDPGLGEVNQLAHNLVQPSDNPMFVTGVGGDATNPAIYNTGVLPTANDDIVVPDGATLTIPAGSTTFVCRTLRINPGGAVVVEKGLDAQNPTELQTRTVIVHRGGSLTSQLATNTERIVWTVDNTAQIDPGRDPQLLGLGFVFCEGANVQLQSQKRRVVMAFTNDMTAGVDDTLTLGHPIFIDDPSLPADDWDAGDNIYFRGAQDASGILAGHESLLGEWARIASRDGADAVLTQACVHDHTSYHDETRRAEAAAFGPPSGSHDEWLGRGLAFNFTRFFLLKALDQNAPIHRRPYTHRAVLSPNQLYYVEEQGFGRGDSRHENLMLMPDGQTNAADTNIRFRDPVMTYRAGWRDWDDIANWTPDMEGVSIWAGPDRQPLGDTHANNVHGEGSFTRGFGFYECAPFTKYCVAGNTIGAAHADWSIFTTGIRYRSIACEQWGMEVESGEKILKTSSFDWIDHHMGARGEGVWFARSTALVQPIAVGCKNTAVHTSSRPQPTGIQKIESRHLLLGPELFEYRQLVNSTELQHQTLLVEGLYGVGCAGGLFVVKSVASMSHSIPSHLKNMVLVGCRRGHHIEYAGGYPILNLVDLGPNPAGKPSGYFAAGEGTSINASIDFGLGVNMSTMVKPYTAHRDAIWQYGKRKANDDSLDYEAEFGVDRTEYFSNAIVNAMLRDTAETVLSSNELPIDQAREVFTGVSTPFDRTVSMDINEPSDAIGSLDLLGTNTDGLMTSRWMATAYHLRHYQIDGQNTNRATGYDGYYEDSGDAGKLFYFLDIAKFSRLTGEFEFIRLPVKINDLPPFNSGRWIDIDTGEFLTALNRGPRDFAADLAAAQAAMASSEVADSILERIQPALD